MNKKGEGEIPSAEVGGQISGSGVATQAEAPQRVTHRRRQPLRAWSIRTRRCRWRTEAVRPHVHAKRFSMERRLGFVLSIGAQWKSATTSSHVLFCSNSEWDMKSFYWIFYAELLMSLVVLIHAERNFHHSVTACFSVRIILTFFSEISFSDS
jgi:hypothetical protein